MLGSNDASDNPFNIGIPFVYLFTLENSIYEYSIYIIPLSPLLYPIPPVFPAPSQIHGLFFLNHYCYVYMYMQCNPFIVPHLYVISRPFILCWITN